MTDWRQYKANAIKGFKGFKEGSGEPAPLKPLEPSEHPNREESHFPFNFDELARHTTLKHLKLEREIKETKGDGSERWQDKVEQWAERAAIKQFDGSLPREIAEEEAAKEYRLTPWLEDLRGANEIEGLRWDSLGKRRK